MQVVFSSAVLSPNIKLEFRTNWEDGPDSDQFDDYDDFIAACQKHLSMRPLAGWGISSPDEGFNEYIDRMLVEAGQLDTEDKIACVIRTIDNFLSNGWKTRALAVCMINFQQGNYNARTIEGEYENHLLCSGYDEADAYDSLGREYDSAEDEMDSHLASYMDWASRGHDVGQSPAVEIDGTWYVLASEE